MMQNGSKAAEVVTPIRNMQRKRSFVMPQSVIAQIVLQFIPSWFAVNMGTGKRCKHTAHMSGMQTCS